MNIKTIILGVIVFVLLYVIFRYIFSSSTQINGLLDGMENGEIPVWAKPAVAQVELMLKMLLKLTRMILVVQVLLIMLIQYGFT